MKRYDDEEDVIFNQRGSHSIIKDRFRFNQKKKSSKSLWIAAISGIIIYILTTYYLVELFSSDTGNKKVIEIQAEVNLIRQEQKTVISKIQALKKELDGYKAQSETLKQQILETKSIQSEAKNSKQAPAQKSSPVASAPKQANPDDQSKKGYMTPELKTISDQRTQKAGLVNTPAGTVRELKLLMKNSDGKTIDQVIYKDDEMRKKRLQFQQQRINFLKEKANFQSLGLVKYNMKYDDSYSDEEKRVDEEEYKRLNEFHQLQKYTQEIPMCVVVPGYNNNAKFRLQYNLNSIFLQNYTNYFIVIINDASTDGSDELFRKYLNFYKIDKSKYVYLENEVRKTALENIYTAAHFYCSKDSVIVTLDGDDQFIGKNVLKIFNAQYQKMKAGVMYSNFYWYEQGGNLMVGFTSDYTEEQKRSASYRQAPQRFSQLRSFRTEIFRKIESKDLQDDNGKFFTSAYDMVMLFPLMEISCGRVNKIAGFHYLYNINTGLNDYQVDRNKQAAVDNKARNSKKYPCDEDFKKRMTG